MVFTETENEKEAYRDILAMLKLLCTLSSQSEEHEQVQDVIFLGISIILPLITTQLLQVFKLSIVSTIAVSEAVQCILQSYELHVRSMSS